MFFKEHSIDHLVKSEDLNHHGTLYAGRCSEWVVEAGFVAVAYELNPKNIVCLRLHRLEFLNPVRAGHIITMRSQIVRTGKTTLTVYIEVSDCRNRSIITAKSYITFCYVDDNTKSQAHGLVFEALDEREQALNDTAIELSARQRL